MGKLKSAFVEGKLTLDELRERSGAALSARTWSEIAAAEDGLAWSAVYRAPAARPERRRGPGVAHPPAGSPGRVDRDSDQHFVVRGPFDSRSRARARRALGTGLGGAFLVASTGGVLRWAAFVAAQMQHGAGTTGASVGTMLLWCALFQVMGTVAVALFHYQNALANEARWKESGDS